MSVLEQIKVLQYDQKAAAEALALGFIRDTLNLDAVSVELRPLAVSLNSFNGFMTLANGQRLFFKTHTEPDNVIGEYYHAAELARAGYPVLQPIHGSTEAGRQLLIYEVINDPSVFDTAWEIETGRSEHEAALTQAQHDADDQLYRIYESTLERQAADAAAKAPVHQLFYHRLVGGRLERFYGSPEHGGGENVEIHLPTGVYSMAQVRQAHWEINGQVYKSTIDDLIAQAIMLLQPAQAEPSIIGHGDAHNGNVFFQQRDGTASLMYFDPAFAGRHHPLLDLTKPLFHNVFAMWMYFPQAKHDETTLQLEKAEDVWHVQHNYALHPIRALFLSSKVQRTLIPILQCLKANDLLRDDWRAYLKAALFCCPLLTMNLADGNKFPPEISLLGLAMTIEMGGESLQVRSLIDEILDSVEKALK